MKWFRKVMLANVAALALLTLWRSRGRFKPTRAPPKGSSAGSRCMSGIVSIAPGIYMALTPILTKPTRSRRPFGYIPESLDQALPAFFILGHGSSPER
jgi:hypothetical protein